MKILFIKNFSLLVFNDVSRFMICCYVLCGDKTEMKRLFIYY